MWLETGISKVEGAFTRTRDDVILAGKQPSPQDHENVALFAALLLRRTMEVVDDMRARLARIPPEKLAERELLPPSLPGSLGYPIPEEHIREAIEHTQVTTIGPLVIGQMQALMRMQCVILMRTQSPVSSRRTSRVFVSTRRITQARSIALAWLRKVRITFPIDPGTPSAFCLVGASSAQRHHRLFSSTPAVDIGLQPNHAGVLQ